MNPAEMANPGLAAASLVFIGVVIGVGIKEMQNRPPDGR